MANYKLKYSGEKIDELLTKIDNLGTGTDTKSGTVKLSSATDNNSGVSDGVAATPKAVKDAYDAASDSIAKNTDAISQLKDDKLDKTATAADSAKLGGQLPAYYATASELGHKANQSDVLTLEEIQASTDLSGKIASASAIRELNTAIANSGLKMDLLWTNASMSSEFSKQTISLDLSNYKIISVVLKFNTTVGVYISWLGIKDSIFYCIMANPTIKYRSFDVTGTRISIGDCYYSSTTYAIETIDNTFLIPYQIYGVK